MCKIYKDLALLVVRYYLAFLTSMIEGHPGRDVKVVGLRAGRGLRSISNN